MFTNDEGKEQERRTRSRRMSDIPFCSEHSEISSNIAVICNDMKYVKSAMEKVEKTFTVHLEEANKEGGFRDRVKTLEYKVVKLEKLRRKELWVVAIVSGIIGSLFGHLAPMAFTSIVKFIEHAFVVL